MDIHAREPSKKVLKNHPTYDIIGGHKANVRTLGVPKVNYREMMGLSLNCYTSIIETKNYKEALSDEFWINVI